MRLRDLFRRTRRPEARPTLGGSADDADAESDEPLSPASQIGRAAQAEHRQNARADLPVEQGADDVTRRGGADGSRPG